VIAETSHNVLIVAHSARPGRASAKNNDLFVCRSLVEQVGIPERCYFPDACYGAETLRHLIGHCQFLIASRFHAMVSGLAMGIPCLLLGWSHKYREVLEQFGVAQFALDYKDISADSLRIWFGRLRKNEQAVRQSISENLPEVFESSLENARLAARLANGSAILGTK
jgi:polysaccharide pyruvyl transferase WcaK-like protein